MNQATIRAILRTRLQAVPDLPLLVYEGEQTNNANVLRITDEVRLGTSSNLASGMTLARPLYFLSIEAPARLIAREVDRLSNSIALAFEPGRTLTDDNRTHFLEVTTLDLGTHRVLGTGWSFRRCTVGLTATAFRTILQTA